MTRNISRIKCHNCHHDGHTHRDCPEPITSYGIIALRTKPCLTGLKRLTILPYCNECFNKMDRCIIDNDRTLSCANGPFVLLVQRKESMAYTDLIRGNYDINGNPLILQTLVSELTCRERHRVLRCNFTELWNSMASHIHFQRLIGTGDTYPKDFLRAQEKYNQHKEHILLLLNDINVLYHYPCPEFGFPKGRANANETPLQCAIREFCEECGYERRHVKILERSPLIEEFIGTNGVAYRHVYFLAEVLSYNGEPVYDLNNPHQAGEISNIGWFNVEQCLRLFRHYDIKKKEVIQEAKLLYEYLKTNRKIIMNQSITNKSNHRVKSI